MVPRIFITNIIFQEGCSFNLMHTQIPLHLFVGAVGLQFHHIAELRNQAVIGVSADIDGKPFYLLIYLLHTVTILYFHSFCSSETRRAQECVCNCTQHFYLIFLFILCFACKSIPIRMLNLLIFIFRQLS